MPYEAPNNILSPGSRLLEFTVPVTAGFWTVPHSDTSPAGWGAPFVTDLGTPVPEPGTSGGPNPVKFISWDVDKSAWESNRTPGNQLYGNIDWLGPYKDPGNPKEESRVRLSYWGPPARQFPSASFIYGSHQKHNEIYWKGLYMAVAPLPVLGAAIQVSTLPTPEGVEPPPPPVLGDWLMVICKDGLGCKVYSRLIPSASYELEGDPEVLEESASRFNIPPDAMTDDMRQGMMELFDSSLNPYGWHYVGTVQQVNGSGAVGVAPNTPWFFNESGDIAQCVQDVQLTFDNGEDASREELGKAIRAIIFANYRAFLERVVDNLSGFTYSSVTDKGSKPHIKVDTDSGLLSSFTFPSCIGEYWQTSQQLDAGFFDYVHREPATPSVDHYLAVDHIRNDTGITGNYIVGVDYYEDDEMYIYLRYDCNMSAEKWWRYCIDRVVATDYDSSGDYEDPASDGYFFNHWAWWDETTGDLIETVDNAVDDSIYSTYAEYVAAGQPIPPYGPSDGRLGAYYGLYGRVWLEWTHPVMGLQTMNLYRAGTFEAYLEDEEERAYLSGVDPLWIQYYNYVHFFDIRPKDGHLSAYYQDRYTKKLTDVGSLGIEVTEIQYNLEQTQQPDNEGAGMFTVVDKRIDPDVVDVNIDTDIPGQLCDMLDWNPAGATASTNEATTTVFARNDFSWDYTVTQYEGEYVPQADFTTADLEPSPQYWHDDNGWRFFPWPKWRDLVSGDTNCVRQGSMTYSGDRYLFTFTYTNTDGELDYYNYITDGDLESIVSPATRFFPAIGT